MLVFEVEQVRQQYLQTQIARSSLKEYVVDESRRNWLLDQCVSREGKSCERVVEAIASCWS